MNSVKLNEFRFNLTPSCANSKRGTPKTNYMWVIPIRYSVLAVSRSVSDLLEGFVCWILIFGFASFCRCLKNLMLLAKKSPRRYVGLYKDFLYKSFCLILTPLPKYYSHTSPDVMTATSRTSSIFFCDHQEYALVCRGQCALPKCAADTAIGQYPCDISSPSFTPRPFIRSCFILFRNHSRWDL